MKKKLKVLVLFDGTSPTTVDQDFSDELKTKEWKTEADVMNALGTLGHTPEHLAIYDDVDLLRQKLETFAPMSFSIWSNNSGTSLNSTRTLFHFSKCKACRSRAAARPG